VNNIITGYFLNIDSTKEFRGSESENNTYYVVKLCNKKVLKINKNTKVIIDLISKQYSIIDIKKFFNATYNMNLSKEEIVSVIEDLKEKNILVHEKQVSRNDKIEKNKLITAKRLMIYISFPFTNRLYMFTDKLKFMYCKNSIKILTLGCIFILSFYALNWNFLYNIDAFNISAYNIYLFYFLLSFGLVIHEIGHITACKLCNVKIKGCGIGFYLIFLQLFVKIDSDIWCCEKKEKLLIDVGGIYFQICYCLLLGMMHLITRNVTFFLTLSLNITYIIFNLNPFFRFDGYWILNDFFESTNFNAEFLKIAKMYWEKKNRRIIVAIGTIIYIVINLFIITRIIIWMYSAIPMLPIKIADIYKIILKKESFNTILNSILNLLIFSMPIIILINILFSLLKKIKGLMIRLKKRIKRNKEAIWTYSK
jgi:putative peptide zinc metalloprotease protein